MDRRPNLAKEADVVGELYIPQESWPFSSFFIFFFCMVPMHAYIFLFNTSIVSIGTDECIAKIRVSKCLKLKFLWDFEKGWNGPKVNVECVNFWLEMGYTKISTNTDTWIFLSTDTGISKKKVYSWICQEPLLQMCTSYASF